jgi:phosphoserine phosphatase RsbX
MPQCLRGNRTSLEYAIASATMAGEAESGDMAKVMDFSGGALIAVADGLGHGEEAARAARAAIATLALEPHRPVVSLMERCHRALAKTRGAVLALASLDSAAGAMSWLSIGNVGGIVLRRRAEGRRGSESIRMRGGIIGHRLPALRETTVPIAPGDLLIFATDGIRRGFDETVLGAMEPQTIADRILSEYGTAADDALVLVARWHGPP